MNGPALRGLGGDGASLTPPRPSPPYCVKEGACRLPGGTTVVVTVAVMTRARWRRFHADLRAAFAEWDAGPFVIAVRLYVPPRARDDIRRPAP